MGSCSPVRALLTLTVLFVCGFLVLRTLLVEPFGVPTGSMAPTLFGHRREAPCARCGYPVRVGAQAGQFSGVPCPNCGRAVDLTHAPEVGGDRLLVDKNVYSLRRPRRWEVAVFRCPADGGKPYVKRVIGLPGEEITLRDGDVYADGEPLRKSLAEVRECLVPVFDMGHVPEPGGWGPRWLVYPPAGPPEPAGPAVAAGGVLVLDASASPETEVRLEYRHWHLDDRREEPVRSQNSYDGPGRGSNNVQPVHDFVLTCDIEVTAAGPDARVAARLFDGAGAVGVEWVVGGSSGLFHDRNGELAGGGPGLQAGRVQAVEFAFVDRRVTVAVGGRLTLGPVDLPAVKDRGEVTRPLQLGARGCRAVVRNLRLSRDVVYIAAGRHGVREPARLGVAEYFVLGDNSGGSEDSRFWDAPGVPGAAFVGKPILVHQPLRAGRVGGDRTVQTIDWSRLRWLR
ncbi:MAG: signal peptidase I [Gemmataceae bacterium]|nr:signal peptidase I [Gemmataceae bacterium]